MSGARTSEDAGGADSTPLPPSTLQHEEALSRHAPRQQVEWDTNSLGSRRSQAPPDILTPQKSGALLAALSIHPAARPGLAVTSPHKPRLAGLMPAAWAVNPPWSMPLFAAQRHDRAG